MRTSTSVAPAAFARVARRAALATIVAPSWGASGIARVPCCTSIRTTAVALASRELAARGARSGMGLSFGMAPWGGWLYEGGLTFERNMRVSSQKASAPTPTARVPQRRRGRARVAALLAAAAEEFAAQGYEAATMTAIAARARAAIMAVIVLHVLKAAVTISGESDLPNRDAVLAELRAMLQRHLGGR